MPVANPEIGRPYRYARTYTFVPRGVESRTRGAVARGILFLSPAYHGHGDKIEEYWITASALEEIGDEDAST